MVIDLRINQRQQKGRSMNSRQRFRATMRYEVVDRVPYFEEPLREEVIEAWHSQGLRPGLLQGHQ